MANLQDDTAYKNVADSFSHKLWSSNLMKVCFKDGYYDFKNRCYKPYDDKTIPTTCIKTEFSKSKNEAVINEVYAKLFDPIFTKNNSFYKEQQLYFLNWIARGLAGNVEENTWSMGLGNRNGGKSAVYDACKNTFEDYVTSFNAGKLLITRVDDGDIAKN